jgi:hypothetical protein
MSVNFAALPGWLYTLPDGTLPSDARWRIRTPDGEIVGIGQGVAGRFVANVRTLEGVQVVPIGGTPLNIPGSAHPKADDAK